MYQKFPYYSPLRYPGGKSWLAPELRNWLSHEPKKEIIEVFAGGASASLLAVKEGLVERAMLVEIDPAICAVWKTIFSVQSTSLCRKIQSFEFTQANVLSLLESSPRGALDLAFQTIVKNRARRGGILASGAGLLKSGERKKGLSSRWYPETLCTRIAALSELTEKFKVVEGDAFSVLQTLNRRRTAAKLFIDPPYTRLSLPGIKPLYCYNHINHGRLFELISKSPHDFLITYDDSEVVRNHANAYRLRSRRVRMRTAHSVEKFELLLTRGDSLT